MMSRIILSIIHYVKYLQHLGVSFTKGSVRFFGHVEWQTQSWIITLDKNAYTTDGVKPITHDENTLILWQYTLDL